MGDEFLVVTKGALESILKISASADEEQISSKSDKLAEAGQRVVLILVK